MNILSEARTRLGLSQKEMAERIGVSRSQVTRMENGTQKIRASYLKMLEFMLAQSSTAVPPAPDTGPPAAPSGCEPASSSPKGDRPDNGLSSSPKGDRPLSPPDGAALSSPAEMEPTS
jgi:transcriptional regulator with XRE-family HTH domain